MSFFVFFFLGFFYRRCMMEGGLNVSLNSRDLVNLVYMLHTIRVNSGIVCVNYTWPFPLYLKHLLE